MQALVYLFAFFFDVFDDQIAIAIVVANSSEDNEEEEGIRIVDDLSLLS